MHLGGGKGRQGGRDEVWCVMISALGSRRRGATARYLLTLPAFRAWVVQPRPRPPGCGFTRGLSLQLCRAHCCNEMRRVTYSPRRPPQGNGERGADPPGVISTGGSSPPALKLVGGALCRVEPWVDHRCRPPGGQLPLLLWFSTLVHLLRALQGRQPRAVVAGAPHRALCRAPSLSVGGA